MIFDQVLWRMTLREYCILFKVTHITIRKITKQTNQKKMQTIRGESKSLNLFGNRLSATQTETIS